MWGFASNAIASIGLKRSPKPREPIQDHSECSDDDGCSNASKDEEGLECPICWESFNIVENVPYVLWCGHTLCQNCVLGLQCTNWQFHGQQFKVPFLISCPWCHMVSLRVLYNRSLRFPRKNFFLLWMVERLNDDRGKVITSSSSSSALVDQPVWSSSNEVVRRTGQNQWLDFGGHGRGGRGGDNNVGRQQQLFSLHKSLDLFIHFTSKFPLAIVLLLVVFFAIPISSAILILYFIVTVVFAIPSCLVLYFAYPTLARLVSEIVS
ncbi:unnamed protein product [Linum tenue]|uniref:RING-type domain-containing protein n=2 Tax=Linum TaxID=4005 RepID=A0AAV0I146_9ROSI|nr:unnamed protein product [Linum tenue]